MTTLEEEALQDEIVRLNGLLVERTTQYQRVLKNIDKYEQILGNAARLATHIAYLCSTLPERSTDIESAADQLHQLLTTRQA